ncbi:MAG: Gldg family protein [Clostridia bacterium]|nr:Gldg family protein [Clostridia bacterium]
MNKRNNRLVKNAGYSLVVSAIVLAVVILLNVLVNAIPVQYTRFDMTRTGLYTATSKETEECLALLDQDIKLYYLCSSGQEDITVKTFVENYATLSSHFEFKVIDPVVYPNFASNYDIENITSNTLIVVNENLLDDKGKPLFYVISGGEHSSLTEDDLQNGAVASEFYGWAQDINAYYSGVTAYYPATFMGEQKMAQAINYVTNEEWPQVYVLAGHGEKKVDYFYDAISNDIIKFNSLTLGAEIPEDCRMILVFEPSLDLTQQEYELLLQYANDGGDIMFVMARSTESKLENFAKLFENYGFAIDFDHYVNEISPSKQYNDDYPFIFYPTLGEDIAFETINKKGIKFMSYYSMPIVELESHRSSIEFNKICNTTTGYLAQWDDEFPDKNTTEYITGAHIVEKYDDVETNIYVFTGVVSDKSYNYLAFSDILKEICDVTLAIEIESVDLAYDQLDLLQSEVSFWSTVVQIVIPAVVLVAGIIVFVIRRRK